MSIEKKLADVLQQFSSKKNGSVEAVQQATVHEIRERNDLSKLRERWADVIWDKTNAAKPELRHPEAARAIIEEHHIACIERSRSDWVFIRFHQEKGFWEKILHGQVDKMIADLVGTKCTQSTLRSVGTLIRAYSAIATDELDAQTNLINLNNCAYDLDTYQNVEHDPNHYFTHKNIYDYDPDATCPIFSKTLELFSMDEQAWVDLFWEIMGYCMTHHYQYQYIFWWPGKAGNGKGTIIRVLTKLVGNAFTKPDFNMKRLSDRFYKGSLEGKRVAICGDMPTELVNIHILKQLSGGDRQSTDTKFGDERHFDPTAKLLFAMNKYPAVPAGEPLAPILRRIVLLPFDYTIRTQDSEIEQKLESELPGIFNEAIKGLQRLRENGGAFTRSERGEHALQRWAGTVNSFKSFIQDCCMVAPENYNWRMFLFELYYEYKCYMDVHFSANWQQNPESIKSTQQLGQELSEQYALRSEAHYYNSSVLGQSYMHGGKDVRGKYPRYYGIRMKKSDDWQAEINPDESIENAPTINLTGGDAQLPF